VSRVHPATGDVFETNLPTPKGAESGFPRPVVVFQAPELGGLATALVIPLTTNLRRTGVFGSLFIASGDGGLTRDSVAQCHLMRALDRKHLRRRLGTLQPETVQALADAILSTIGIAVEP
jgi:mRNA-degrading endonuclease toxin of MazEF toxin-antitoxin module